MALNPTPIEAQADFFTNLQHLLVNGQFVSTYKYALLITLARWALENPDHDESVPLDAGELSEHFLALYWPHARPFGVQTDLSDVAEPQPPYGEAGDSSWSSVLLQDRGHQKSRALNLILAEQQLGTLRLRDLSGPRRDKILREVRTTICDMPLWRLHETGESREFRFLYHRGASKREIIFKPGIVACLAGFSPLIEELVRAAWLRLVLRSNPKLVGTPASQLEEFLFPSQRGDLSAWKPALESLQGRDCFYCQRSMTASEVDHFLPWSLYKRDLGHNFVLAHPACNNNKSDHLASIEHLERWCMRNDEHAAFMAQAFDKAGLPHDWPTLRKVAGSLYEISASSSAEVWNEGKELDTLDQGWRRVLASPDT